MGENIIKISNYIDDNFNNTVDYEICLNQLKNLRSFLFKIKCSIKIDDIIILLNNNQKLNDTVKVVFDRNEEAIISGNMYRLFRTEFIKTLLSIYCVINNIEIADDIEPTEEINEKNTESGDIDLVDLYLKDISNYEVLTYEEEQELARRYKAGDMSAKEEFITKNLRLVANRAKNYFGKGFSYSDLIGYGNIGLLSAVEAFKPELGYRFSTFAKWRIDQAINRAIDEYSQTIRIPTNLSWDVRRYNRIRDEIKKEIGHDPTIDEMCQVMGISKSKALNILRANSIKMVSINNTLNEDGDTEISEVVPDPNIHVEESALNNTVNESLREILNNNTASLTKRQIAVLRYRYGFYDGKEHTLEEVANMLHDSEIDSKKPISREGVRQIEDRSLRKLNRPWIKKDFNYSSCDDPVIVNETLRDMLSGYSRGEICNIVVNLSAEDKSFLIQIFGINLDQKFNDSLDVKGRIKFFGTLLPKIKRLLAKNHDDYVSHTNDNQYNELLTRKNEEQKEINMTSDLFFNRKETKFLNKLEDKINHDDFMKLVDIIQLMKSDNEYRDINIVGLTIVLLSMGYVNEKYYGNIEIATLLSIAIESVSLYKRVILNEYRDKLFNRLEEITGKKVGNNKPLVLKKSLL